MITAVATHRNYFGAPERQRANRHFEFSLLRAG